MIYVLGSINMDLVANVSHMPIAGETMMADKFFVNPGGKGANQAVAVAKLGGEVKMIGKIGTDVYGKALRDNLSANGVDVEFVTEAEGSSGIAIILVEGGDNRIILENGANFKITKGDIESGLSKASAGDILIMQLEIPPEMVEYAAKLAKAKGVKVILNPAPAVPLNDSLLSYCDIVSPNESECEILTGINPSDDVNIALAVKHFYKKGVGQVVITLGAKGAVVTEGNIITPIEPQKVKVVDTTSAGDTFIGACALKLYEGRDIVEAGRFASVASSITIQRAGASSSIPTKEEVEKVLQKLK